jgi:DNA/RNA endonuclease G (NUC1)
MSGTKTNKPVRKERLLMVLTNGGVITKKQIEDTMQYKAMYRIPTELWKLKNMGAVIRSHKDGRTVIGYELLNVDEMKALLKAEGFETIPLVTDASIKKLGDLKAKKSSPKVEAPAVEDEVIEITE